MCEVQFQFPLSAKSCHAGSLRHTVATFCIRAGLCTLVSIKSPNSQQVHQCVGIGFHKYQFPPPDSVINLHGPNKANINMLNHKQPEQSSAEVPKRWGSIDMPTQIIKTAVDSTLLSSSSKADNIEGLVRIDVNAGLKRDAGCWAS